MCKLDFIIINSQLQPHPVPPPEGWDNLILKQGKIYKTEGLSYVLNYYYDYNLSTELMEMNYSKTIKKLFLYKLTFQGMASVRNFVPFMSGAKNAHKRPFELAEISRGLRLKADPLQKMHIKDHLN